MKPTLKPLSIEFKSAGYVGRITYPGLLVRVYESNRLSGEPEFEASLSAIALNGVKEALSRGGVKVTAPKAGAEKTQAPDFSGPVPRPGKALFFWHPESPLQLRLVGSEFVLIVTTPERGENEAFGFATRYEFPIDERTLREIVSLIFLRKLYSFGEQSTSLIGMPQDGSFVADGPIWRIRLAWMSGPGRVILSLERLPVPGLVYADRTITIQQPFLRDLQQQLKEVQSRQEAEWLIPSFAWTPFTIRNNGETTSITYEDEEIGFIQISLTEQQTAELNSFLLDPEQFVSSRLAVIRQASKRAAESLSRARGDNESEPFAPLGSRPRRREPRRTGAGFHTRKTAYTLVDSIGGRLVEEGEEIRIHLHRGVEFLVGARHRSSLPGLPIVSMIMRLGEAPSADALASMMLGSGRMVFDSMYLDARRSLVLRHDFLGIPQEPDLHAAIRAFASQGEWHRARLEHLRQGSNGVFPDYVARFDDDILIGPDRPVSVVAAVTQTLAESLRRLFPSPSLVHDEQDLIRISNHELKGDVVVAAGPLARSGWIISVRAQLPDRIRLTSRWTWLLRQSARLPLGALGLQPGAKGQAFLKLEHRIIAGDMMPDIVAMAAWVVCKEGTVLEGRPEAGGQQ